jgi:hypothetical protein
MERQRNLPAVIQIIKTQSRPGLPYDGVPGRSVHSAHLERWLGREALENASNAMKDWYGPPIALSGVPGKVFVHRGGDFRGELRAGYEMSAMDKAMDVAARLKRSMRHASKANALKFNAGFSSLSDLINEATAGAKRRDFTFQKVANSATASSSASCWRNSGWPAAGGAGSAAPGGRVLDDTTTGAFPFFNPTGGDTQHLVSATVGSSAAGNTLLLYDRLFDVAKTMNSAATEAVTGVPTRYQSTTAANADYIGGNFLFPEVGGTALAATAHNWTVCTYTDQTNAASTIPSAAGVSGAGIDRIDLTSPQWFMPLEAGDVGIKALTQMQCSAAVATGLVNFVIGHPLALFPCPVANSMCGWDGINTAFSLVRVFDDAAMAFLDVMKPTSGTPTFTGIFTTVAG